MNNLVTMTNGTATVTSRQVAENFGKEHSKVKASIENIMEELGSAEIGDTSMFTVGCYVDQWNRNQAEFTMNRDGWTLLTMGFTGSKALQWKLKYIAAFNDMEKQLSTHAIPQTRAEALRLAADAMEQLDSAKTLIEIMEPKAKAFDIFIDCQGYYSVGTAAKMLNTGRNRLFAFMAIHKIIMDSNVPYQCYVDRGYFAVKGHNGITYVSPKGLQWLSEKLLA